MNRRDLLLSGLLSAVAGAPGAGLAQSAANQWFAITGDDGRPVPNGRAPVELVEDIDDLPGAIWGGAATPAVTLIEFYDYNCPFCRASAPALAALMRQNGDLRVGLVNNPILSPQSAQAAKVEFALTRLKGAGAAHALFRALFEAPGRIDGPKALDAAAALGVDRAALERLADSDEIRETMRRHLGLAASLGLVATPSYVIGGAGVLGYPGSATLGRLVAQVRACGLVSC